MVSSKILPDTGETQLPGDETESFLVVKVPTFMKWTVLIVKDCCTSRLVSSESNFVFSIIFLGHASLSIILSFSNSRYK